MGTLFTMAKDKISMPSGTAGITRYFEGNTSKITFSPGHVILLCLVVMIVIALLHLFGDSWFGL